MTRPHPLPPGLQTRAFSVADAVSRGVLADRLRRTDLAAPFHGVRRPAGDSGWYSDCVAFATRMPPNTVFSHVTAARLLGIPIPARLEQDARVHVTTIDGRALRGQGVAGYASRRDPHPQRVGRGLRATSAVRTWTDLSVLLDLDELVVAGDRLLGLPAPLAPRAEVAEGVQGHAGLRGSRNLVRAFELVRPGSRSPRETRARLALLRAGVLEPEMNGMISAGGRTLHGDLVFRRWRVLLEYEGDQHRTDARQWAHDLERYNDLAEAGWLVIRASKAMPDAELVSRTTRALRSRGWTP